MKYNCIGVCWILLGILSGCVLPVEEPAQQIACVGKLPKSVTINHSEALSFAVKFASETGMTNIEVFPEIGSLTNRFVDINFSGPNRMNASIMFNNDVNQFVIVVYGDRDSPIVQAIVHKGVELFQKTYPNGSIAPYSPK